MFTGVRAGNGPIRGRWKRRVRALNKCKNNPVKRGAVCETPEFLSINRAHPRREINRRVAKTTTGLTSTLHDPAVTSVIQTEYMIIAFTTNGQSFGACNVYRRKPPLLIRSEEEERQLRDERR